MIPIAELVQTTWLTIYPRLTEITYDQGTKFIGNEFVKYRIEEEYGIIAKPCALEDPTSNVILERIHQVLGNLVRTYNMK